MTRVMVMISMVIKIMITMMILMMTTMAIQITSWSHFIRVEVLS